MPFLVIEFSQLVTDLSKSLCNLLSDLNVVVLFMPFKLLFLLFPDHLKQEFTATWKMFRSKATMEQHAKKYTQNKNNSTRMESHMQPIGNLHDDSHRSSSFRHTLFRPPFCSTIQQNSFPSSSSADFQSIRSNPTAYNPNLYDSMMHHSTSSSYSKPTTFEPMLHQSTSSSYSKPPASETMLHQSTSSSYSKPMTFEPMLHPSTSTLSDQPSSSRTSLHQFSSSFHLNQDDEDEDEDEDQNENDEESKEVEIVDEYGSILRVQKMTAKDVYKLTEGEKVLVHVNDSFQLIKGAAGVCTRKRSTRDHLIGLSFLTCHINPETGHTFMACRGSSWSEHVQKMKSKEMTKENYTSKSRPVDDEVRSKIADAVMMDLIGPDKPGQALGYGTEITKSKVTKFKLIKSSEEKAL
ncbi:hypothetical protein Tco_1045290 [Tanacetum coccineum]|uniref:Uncharacterized protein n=1 Tax=Tanacetum coccineum TaxID=301880 RepID=A0ABQ5GT84_9ASTR